MRVCAGWLIPLLAVACGSDSIVRPRSAANRWLSVGAADRRACGLTLDGRAWCWGVTTSDPSTPVDGAPPLASITVGAGLCPRGGPSSCPEARAGHVCALDTQRLAWCWGRNDHGQLGDGTTRARNRPAKVTGSIRYRSIHSGNAFTCAVSVDSIAYCWGYNGRGNLGVGVADPLSHPVPRAIARGVAVLATGSDHACGVDADGSAFCWGDDFRARLGSDAAVAKGGSGAPVPVNGVHRFMAVSAGVAHTCGLTPAGLVFCWGSNAEGELGSDPLPSYWRDPAAAVIPPLVSLSAGTAEHTCGITSSGRAWCWGSDADGQLGSGRFASSCRGIDCPATYSPVKTRARFRSLTTGRDFTCGVTLADQLLCWGRLPSTPDHPRQTPVPVAIRLAPAPSPDRVRTSTHRIHFRDSVTAPGNQQ